jgi:Protein of unknown function (DUF3558)
MEGALPVDTSERVLQVSIPGAPAGRHGVHADNLVPLAVFALLGVALAGCGGSSSTGAAAAASTTHHVAAPSPASGRARDACALVSTADLRSLGVTGAGSSQTITRGTATVYACTWGHPPGRELHLQFEPLDPKAASQVGVSLGGQGTAVPGLGGGARGQFGSVLAAVNFSKGSTFVAMALFGTGTGGRKGAFIAVAKNVASHL